MKIICPLLVAFIILLCRLPVDAQTPGALDPAFAPAYTSTVTASNVTVTSGRVRTLLPGPAGVIVDQGPTINGAFLPYARLHSITGGLESSFTDPVAIRFDRRRPLLVLPDGKILEIHNPYTGTAGVENADSLIRSDANGNLDASFTRTKLETLNGQNRRGVNCAILLPDGKILVGGEELQRVHENGTIDTSFSTQVGTSNLVGTVWALARQADGRILVAHSFGRFNSHQTHVIRLQADGGLDASFQPTNPDHFVEDIVVQPDGKIIIAGRFGNVNGLPRVGMARLGADGVVDAGFQSFIGHSDHYMTTADDATQVKNKFADFNGTTTDQAVHIRPAVNRVALQADGKMFIFGLFDKVGLFPGNSVGHVIRLNANGSWDPTFTGRVDRGAGAGYLQPGHPEADHRIPFTEWHDAGLALEDGTLLVGSQFTLANDTLRPVLARFHAGPAERAISFTNHTRAIWTRGGSCAELLSVTFDQSSDGGNTWVRLGEGSRIGTSPNWEITGQNLGVGVLRARGLLPRGGLIEQTQSYEFAAPPATSNPVVTNIGTNSATLGGTVTESLAGLVASRGVVLSPTAVNGDPVIGGNGVQNISGSGTTGAFAVQASSLASSTQYSFKAYATYPGGVAYSAVNTFTTAAPVTLAAPTVSNLQYSSATFNVAWSGGATATERGFLYGRSLLTSDPQFPGDTHVTRIVVPGTAGAFVRDVSGLLAGTDYTFRAYAVHSGGVAYSPVTTFTTPVATGPTAVTLDVSNVTTTSVTLNGTVTGNGYGGTAYFQYGLPWQDLQYAQSIPAAQPVSGGPTAVSATVSGLMPHTQYRVRVVGEGGPSGWVTAYGGEVTFTTANAAPVAMNSVHMGREDESTGLELNASDADGDTLAFTIVTQPAHGVVTPVYGQYMRYWPDPDYNSDNGGHDSFTFTVSDGHGGTSSPATVTIQVTPVNDPPTIDDIATPAPILEDAGDKTILVEGITAGPLEPSQTLTVTAFSNDLSLIPTPTVKYITGRQAEITYRPVANANGTAVLSVTVSDGGLATSRSFNAAVTAVNDRPSFVIPTAPIPAGALWTPRDTNRSWNSIRSSPDGVKLVASVASGYIYTSSDSGETWTPRSGSGSRQWTAVATSSDGSRLAATEQYGSVYISTDSGATWQRQLLDWNVDKNESWNSIASSADGLKMIALSGHVYTYSAGLGFYKGGDFMPQSWRGVACSADGSQRAAVVYGGQIYTVSTYSSSSGTPRDSNRNWTAVACSSDGRKMAATVEGGQIYISTDFGANWTPRGPVRSWRKITSSADGTKLAAIGGSLIYTSTDSGLTWAEHGVSQNWTDITSSADGEKLAAVVEGGQIYTSTALPYSVPAAANAGPVSMRAFATSISPGPPDEAAQTLSFTVTNDRSSLFTTQPALDAAGTLTFTPNPAMTGTALVTVTVQDNGGTANGGVNTSFTQTFNIAVGQSTPVVTTPTNTGITRTAATLGANITSDGGAPIMERGVVYSLSADNSNPVKGGAGVVTVMITGTTGVLTTNVSDLAPASSYTFKAYAITSAGISYSPAATFATLGQGDLDLAFGTGGKTTTAVDLDAIVSDVAVQSDGKVVITGSSSKMGIAPAVELVRFTSGGALDTSFGVNGRVTTSIGSTTSRGQAVVIQGDGKILVLADARAEGQVLPVVAVARYTSSGVLDSSFGNGGIVLTPTVATSSETAYASDLVLQSDGRIVVAGMITVGGVRSYMLLRYTTSGALDTSFGTGGKSIVPAGFINPASVAMQGDGKIVVAGGGLDVTQVFELARFTSNGALDTGFGTNGVVKTSFGSGYASALSVALQSDGKIVAAGKTSMSGGQAVALARYTAQGALDADFGAGGKLTTRISAEDEAQGVAVQSDGKIVVGGWTDNGSSVYYNNSFAVWRYTSTGALDTSFGSGGVAITSFGGGRDRATSLALGGDGTIVVAGTDDTNPGIYPTKYQFAVARYLGGAVPPSLTWPLSSSITVTGATLGGTVTGGGGAGVSERGIVYAPTATNSNPVIGGNGVVKVPVTGTTGAFTTAVTGLAPGTTYSYKAYATNPLGTSYTGAGVFTTTGSLPVVTTPTLAAVTLTSALLGGNVTQAGDAPVIERGVVYAPASVNDNPAIGGAGVTKVSVPGTTGVFTVNVTGLDVTTSHGFRAYAISALGVSYSSMLSFTTASNNANLAALSLSAGTLSPAFAPGTSSYTASVPNATTAITLTPASAQNHAAIFINNVRVMSGAASMSIPLELGENLVSTVVIASDAVTTRTYTVRVTRTALPVIILPGSGQVSTTSATLGATLTSTGFAAIEEQGIVIAPTAINDTPRIGGAGVIKLTNVAAFADRYEVSATGLTPGVRYSFAGFATNSEGTSYTSTGAFTTVSDDASLSALVLSAGTLSPGFSGSTTAYDCIVPNVTTSLTVTPTTTNANATIRVNNVVVASGSASPALSLHVGLNSITIAVTAPDGATIRTYTVAVTRQSVTENALDNWAAEKGLPPSAAGPLADADGDGVPNLMEFAFGTSPSANSSARMQFSGTFAGGVTVSQNGQPVVAHEPKADGTDFRAVFVRRADHEAVGLTYTVKFSADLVNWQTSTVTPTVLGTDGTHEAVSVPYPPFIGGKKARFFTVGVDAAP